MVFVPEGPEYEHVGLYYFGHYSVMHFDFMKRFMLLKNARRKQVYTAGGTEFMQEMEDMRVRAKAYFPSDFDAKKIWEEALDEKYNHIS